MTLSPLYIIRIYFCITAFSLQLIDMSKGKKVSEMTDHGLSKALALTLLLWTLVTSNVSANSLLYNFNFDNSGSGDFFYDDVDQDIPRLVLDFGSLGRAEVDFSADSTSLLFGNPPGNYLARDNIFFGLSGGTAKELRLFSDGTFCVKPDNDSCVAKGGTTPDLAAGTYNIAPASPTEPVQILWTSYWRDNFGAGPFGAGGDVGWIDVGVSPNPQSPSVVGGVTEVAITKITLEDGTTDSYPFGDLPLLYVGTTINPAEYLYLYDYTQEQFLGPIEVTARNSFTTNFEAVAWTTELPLDTPLLPFPESVAISGSGSNPTFTWTVPDGFIPDDFNISIFRNDQTFWNFIHSEGINPESTSYTVPDVTSSGIPLELGEEYSLRISMNLRREEGSLLSRSSAFFGFTLLADEEYPNVFLPSIDPSDGTYSFTVTVQEGQTVFIDPIIAIGYDYETGEGDPPFSSLTLPDLGDGLYNLWLFNGDIAVNTGLVLENGIEYSFEDLLSNEIETTGLNVDDFFDQSNKFIGVTKFRIDGIEKSVGVDPANPTAFITGLSFMADGQFTGTMVPITVEVADPIVVNIEINPGDEKDCINVNGRGVIPVAILGSAEFDVAQIDQQTVKSNWLGVGTKGNGQPQCSADDINQDDQLDLLCKFKDDLSIWKDMEGQVKVTGELLNGDLFEGAGDLCLVP